MVEGAFKEVTGSLIKDSFGESQDEVLAAVKRFQSRVGVKVSDGAVFLNGKFIDLDEVSFLFLVLFTHCVFLFFKLPI